MKVKSESSNLIFIRSLAMGVLISMLLMYAVHVLGDWQVENYRPDPETTSTVLLHNTCAIFGSTHTLRPNTDISRMDASIDGTKLGASFMNFFDGHIIMMLLLAVLIGGLISVIRQRMSKARQARQ